jgi:hypothetical protein
MGWHDTVVVGSRIPIRWGGVGVANRWFKKLNAS